VDVPADRRGALEPILQESFEGLYLWHAKKTLHDLPTVRAAMLAGEPVGLIMPKSIEPSVGYVFYVAVTPAHRGTGVARQLLRDALQRFRSTGAKEVFASVEEDNIPSEKLFEAEGFKRTSLLEVTKRYGPVRALNMYRMMVVVPGEVLLHLILAE
jgi:ribosomal protein S18 acetylase RimI-like enzyme